MEAGDESSREGHARDYGYVSAEYLVMEIGAMFRRECGLHLQCMAGDGGGGGVDDKRTESCIKSLRYTLILGHH